MLGAAKVIAIDRFPYRLRIAAEQGGAETINYEQVSVSEALREMTAGRGPDHCIDAVGLEGACARASRAPTTRPRRMMMLETDRPVALREAIMNCRSGGTISVAGRLRRVHRQVPDGRHRQPRPHDQVRPDPRAPLHAPIARAHQVRRDRPVVHHHAPPVPRSTCPRATARSPQGRRVPEGGDDPVRRLGRRDAQRCVSKSNSIAPVTRLWPVSPPRTIEGDSAAAPLARKLQSDCVDEAPRLPANRELWPCPAFSCRAGRRRAPRFARCTCWSTTSPTETRRRPLRARASKSACDEISRAADVVGVGLVVHRLSGARAGRAVPCSDTAVQLVVATEDDRQSSRRRDAVWSAHLHLPAARVATRRMVGGIPLP